jgi:hypothetical protein
MMFSRFAACYHAVMTTRFPQALGALALVPLLAALAGCNPKYNWRDYASPDAPYRIMFPAKPGTFTREIDLDGLRVPMTMTAAEVDGATFAVGTAQAPDAARAQVALEAVRTALVRNIAGKVTREKRAGDGGAADIEARGAANGVPMRLSGHFETRGTRLYQVIVVGRTDKVPDEQVEQFLSSFTPQ